jgi:serine protease Do
VPLTAVEFGDSDRLRRGQAVILIGNPFGLDGSVSRGIISAIGRDIGTGPYNFIQTDAAMHKGSAGGPLFNIAGEVVGMASSVMRAERDALSVGFAIPSNLIKVVTGQLQRTGAISRGWLGVKIHRIGPR